VDDKTSIVRKIVAGDKRAFRLLVDEYQRLVNHIAFRMVSNPGDREDICQDIFMRVYQNLAGFRHDSRLSTWIARIAYNCCIDYLNKNNIPFIDEEFDETISNMPGGSITPEQQLYKSDISNLLQKEIGLLPVKFRAIITLYHLDEMSYAEIGDIMSMPEGTVKNYLFRARRLLRDRLMLKYGEEELRQ